MSYADAMNQADETYRDVTDALQAIGTPASVTQTGGMCLAISWETTDGYWLLTDEEGPLPWERAELTGWALGRYGNDNSEPLTLSTVTDPSLTAAVTLVADALQSGGVS